MRNTYGMSNINPITPTSTEKMTGAGVHHSEHSRKSCYPSFEHLRIYDRNLPIKKHSEHISRDDYIFKKYIIIIYKCNCIDKSRYQGH